MVNQTTALHSACSFNSTSTLSYILRRKQLDVNMLDSTGRPALNYCAANGQYEAVKALASLGASLDSGPFSPLMDAAYTGNQRMAKLLIDLGADSNLTSARDGRSALHYACVSPLNSADDVAFALLQSGADWKAQEVNGLTAFSLAAGYGKVQIVKYVISYTQISIYRQFDVKVHD